METATEEMHTHCEMLEGIRKTTRLSIISGMFFEWDKQVRNWVAHEISRWHRGAKVREEVWKRNFDELIIFFEGLLWPVMSRGFYNSLNRCRLVVNAYKHGNGAAFERIKQDHKDLICAGINGQPIFDWYDFSMLGIEETHIEEFSNAIIHFWEDLPENPPCSENHHFPEWFMKAVGNDQKNGRTVEIQRR